MMQSPALNHVSAEPVYQQIADTIRQRITDGTYPAGGALPTEEALGNHFGIGRMAIRRALAVLRNEGLVTTQRGRPTTVRAQPDRTYLTLGPNDRVIARMPNPAEQRALQLLPGVPLLEVTRHDGTVNLHRADQIGLTPAG